MQEEDGDDGVERSGVRAAIFEPGISNAEALRVRARLPNGGGREIHADDLADVRREQQFRIADAAAEAQHAGIAPGAGRFENSPHHVRA